MCALALAPAAGAADWLPAFDLGATGVRDAGMTPGGDIVLVVNTAAGPALRFRPAGGPLGPLEQPVPAGAGGVRVDLDAQGNVYLVWTRAGTAEMRVRRRDGILTDIQTLQSGVLEGTLALAVSGDGHAAVAWVASDVGRAGGARTRAPDGTLGPAQAVTVAAEKTRTIDADVDAAGNVTFAWTTPDAPPNTKIKARRLAFETQTLSAVLPVSTPPVGELSDTERVVVDPAGDATLVWRHLTAAASLVETRQLSAAGTLGTTQVLTAAGDTSQFHDVAVDDAGRARITWVEHTAGGSDPFQPVTCFSAVGSSCGAKLTLGAGPSLSTSIAVGPAGDALVGFAASGTAPGQVRVLPRPGGGAALVAHTLGPAAQLPLLGADSEGNGVAVWDEGGAAKAEGFDNAPPVVQALSIPAVIERTDPVAATATVRDVWGATVAWSFGDGGSADGAAVQHAFARTGTFEVRATATDGTGATAAVTAAVTVRDTRAPALGRVTMRRTRFRVARSATPVSAAARRRQVPRGSDLRFTLGEDAAVTIAVQRRTVGRRVGRACRQARGVVPRARRCVRFVSAGRTLRRTLAAGRRRVAFTGRIGRRALAPGRYRVRVQATDAARNRSGVRTKAFTVVR